MQRKNRKRLVGSICGMVLALIAIIFIAMSMNVNAEEDTTPPVVTITAPVNGLVTNQDVTLSYTVSDDISAPENISISGPASGTVYSSEGAYDITITATDEAGNSASASVLFTVDKTAPTISITGPTAGYYNTNQMVSWSVSDVNLDSVTASHASPTTFSTDGTYQVTVSATDLAGNSASAISSQFVIDKTAPTISITGPTAGYYNTNQMVSWSVSDTNLDSVTASHASPTTFSTDGTYQVTVSAIDLAGNSASASSSQFVIDKTAPTISITGPTAGYYNTDQTVTWSVSDVNLDSVTASHMSPTTFLTDGVYQVTVSATDLAGNSATASSSQFVIDKTAPTISITGPTAGYYNTDQTVTWSVSDTNLDSVTASHMSPTTFLTDGVYQVTVSATDLAGNSASASSSQFVIDKTAPTISITGPAAGYYNTNQVVSWSVSDTNLDSVTASHMSPTTFLTDGVYQVTVSATDLAGNSASAISSQFVIDKTAPTISITGPTAGYYNTNQMVSWSVSDTNLDSVTASHASPTTFSTDGTYQVTVSATDLAGNSASASSSQFVIDKTAPTISITGPTAGYYNTDQTVTWSVSDVNLDSVTASHMSPTTFLTDGVYQVTVSATDLAGNSASASSAQFVIDKTNPTISVASRTPYTANDWNNNDVTVTYSASDALSGIDPVASDYSADTLTGEGAGQSVTGYVYDMAGNFASVTQTGINIDKTNPTISVASRTPYTANDWNNNDVTVTYSASDVISGIDAVVSDYWADTLTVEGVGQSVTGYVYDMAGNFASVTQTGINIDKTTPTTTLQLIGYAQGTDPVEIGETTEFNLDDAMDNLAGVASTEYYIDTGPWATYNNPFTYDVLGDHWLYFRSIDTAGNVEATQSLWFHREPTVEFPSITDEDGNDIDVNIIFEQDGQIVAETNGSTPVIVDPDSLYDITIEVPGEDVTITLEDATISADTDVNITIDEQANPTHNFELLVDDIFLKDIAVEITGITAASYKIDIKYNQDELDSAGIFDNSYASLWKYYSDTDTWNQISPADVSDPVSIDPGPPEVFQVTTTLDHLCNIAFVFEIPELILEICTGNTQILAGEEIEYTVHLENYGAGRARNLDLTIDLPAEVVFVSSTIQYSFAEGQEFHWQWDYLCPGESITFYITVRTSLLFQEGDIIITTADITFYGPTTTVYHELAQPSETLIVSVEPSGELGGIGFWSHQVLAILDGKGRNQISEEDLELYLDMTQASCTLFDLDSDGALTLEEAKAILVHKKADMYDRALRQLLAVHLNIAVRAVNADTQIDMALSENIELHQYDYLTTVSEAVQFVTDVLQNENSELYETVKDICEEINNGTLL